MNIVESISEILGQFTGTSVSQGTVVLLLLLGAVVCVALLVSAGTRRKETFDTLDAVVEDTRERFRNGEYDD